VAVLDLDRRLGAHEHFLERAVRDQPTMRRDQLQRLPGKEEEQSNESSNQVCVCRVVSLVVSCRVLRRG
jgi:hypothetical protein